MILLLTDHVVLTAPSGTVDSHGWAVDAHEVVVWEGEGNLQETTPFSNAAASEAGGDGPFSPRHMRLAVLYLPPGTGVAPGMVAEVYEHGLWIVDSVTVVHSPDLDGPLAADVCAVHADTWWAAA